MLVLYGIKWRMRNAKLERRLKRAEHKATESRESSRNRYVRAAVLLLPVAAAYGWFMGRNSVRSEERKEQQQFSKKYAAGLNLLLSDEPDKAVDLFVELLDVDSDTLETHWTLGTLFRRRGEVERAIKIHQNLINRSNITEYDRLNAMFELGKDYLSAGIYDRAEQMFSRLQITSYLELQADTIYSNSSKQPMIGIRR